jgi:hypothetical protein
MREYAVEIEVRCLERPVHSGQKGGPFPDVVQILCRLLADHVATDGSMRISAFEAHPILGSANQILPQAWARILMKPGARADGARLARRLGRRPPFGAQVRARLLALGRAAAAGATP